MGLFFKKQKQITIIDTGTHLPNSSVEQELRFMSEKDRFLKIEIEKQTRKKGNIIYGCQAVNRIVGPLNSRPTSDWDIMSKNPRGDAVELEQKIDNHVGANISHVEQVRYDRDGKKGKMYRVVLKNFDTLADYNPVKPGVKTVTINGVKYENLKSAEKKYMKMLGEDDTKRLVNANQDLNRISLFRYWKKIY